jgi:hypothetical protein
MTKQNSKMKLPPHTEKAAQDLAYQAIRKIRMAERWKAGNGRDPWSELCSRAYGDGSAIPRKLTHEDAHKIARQLHDYLEEIAPKLKSLGISKTDLCSPFGNDKDGPMDSKELHRLTLSKNADAAKRGIRVDAAKYVQFIEALALRLGESVSLVAAPILRNTSLHPLARSEDELTDIDRIQILLQEMVDKIDDEFNLTATYNETAALKCQNVRAGEMLCWPLEMPYELTQDGMDETNRDAYDKAYAVAYDPKQAFLRRSRYYGRHNEHQSWHLYCFETGALQDDEFFYVPHAPLGHMLIWDLPDRRVNRVDYARAVDLQLARMQRAAGSPFALPADEWDAERKMPRGQTSQGNDDVALQHHFWLLAYPHPDRKRLVPTLYQPGEEGGAYVLPLDTAGLSMLTDVVAVSSTSHCNALEHLKRLLLDLGEDGMNPIERNLRRTAAWLTENPVVKHERTKKEVSRRLDQLFRS